MPKTHENRLRLLKRQINKGMVHALRAIEKFRPRLVIGEGQGGSYSGYDDIPIGLGESCPRGTFY